MHYYKQLMTNTFITQYIIAVHMISAKYNKCDSLSKFTVVIVVAQIWFHFSSSASLFIDDASSSSNTAEA
jgi:hypothetical protein